MTASVSVENAQLEGKLERALDITRIVRLEPIGFMLSSADEQVVRDYLAALPTAWPPRTWSKESETIFFHSLPLMPGSVTALVVQ